MVEKLIDGQFRCERSGCGATFPAKDAAMSHQADRIPHIVTCATSELLPWPHDKRYHGGGFVVALRKLREIRPLSDSIYQTPDAAEDEKSAIIGFANQGNQTRH